MADPTNPNPAAVTDPNAAAAALIDYKAKLLSLLKLPAEATDEQIDAAITTAAAAPAAGDTTDLQKQLDTANARVLELETAAQQAAQEEADELLEEYGELPDDTKTVLREQLLADPAKGKALLAAMPKKKKAAAKPAEGSAAEEKKETPAQAAAEPDGAKTPSAPKHDPKEAAKAPSAAEKAAQSEKLIKTVQAEGKFKDYTSAREEARRRKPELFA